MSKTKLDEILEGQYRWTVRAVTDYNEMKPILGTGTAEPLSPSEATKAIQSLVAEAVPEKVPDGPIDHEAEKNSIPWETGWNKAVEQVTEALKERGLMER